MRVAGIFYLHNRHPIIFVDNAVNGSDLAYTISDLEFNRKIYTQDNPRVHSCHQVAPKEPPCVNSSDYTDKLI